MLYIIGLGLGDEQDITLRGLKVVRSCTKEILYGKSITLADRESDDILSEANHSHVAFLVVGDPFRATTYTDLVVRAKEMGIDVKIVHNASVMNAIGICGLQLYRYRETVSIPFFTDTWRPDSFYEVNIT